MNILFVSITSVGFTALAYSVKFISKLEKGGKLL